MVSIDQKHKQTILNVGLNSIFYLFSYFIVSKGILIILLLLGKNNEYNNYIFFFGIGVSLILIGILYFFWRKVDFSYTFRTTVATNKQKILYFLIGFLIMITLSYVLALLSNKGLTENVPTTLKNNSYKHMVNFYLFRTIILVPIYEETLFRGFLLSIESKLLTKINRSKLYWVGITLAILINSFLFATMHNPSNSLSLLLFLLFGIISSSLYLLTKDLKFSIFLHQLNNFLALFSSF